MTENIEIIQSIYQVVLDRKNASSDSSYTAALLQGGVDKILKKIGEEATEVVIAAKGGNQNEIVYETADLVYHLLVLLGHQNITPEDIYTELRRRFGTSGIAEKAARTVKAE